MSKKYEYKVGNHFKQHIYFKTFIDCIEKINLINHINVFL